MAMKALPLQQQQWVSKHVSGFCGVGKMMKLWKKWPDSSCPRCGEAIEDSAHVWQCQETNFLDVWDKSIENLRQWMISNQTQPGIQAAICSGLQAWKHNTERPPVASWFARLQEALKMQDQLGWQALLEGCFSTKWQGVQQLYYVWMGIRKTGRCWLSTLIQKLWEVAWDQWEHRNGYVHVKGSNAIMLQKVRSEIRIQFHQGQQMLPECDHQQFNHTLQSLLDAPIGQQWLANVQAARQRSLRRNCQEFRPEREFLNRWMQQSASR